MDLVALGLLLLNDPCLLLNAVVVNYYGPSHLVCSRGAIKPDDFFLSFHLRIGKAENEK